MKNIISNPTKLNEKFWGTSVIKGSLISLIISIICLFIYAIILVNTNIKENTIAPVVITITGISILIGSSISSIKIKKNGILNGMCIGGIYFFTLYILSSMIFTGFSCNLKSLLMIIVGMLTGAIGGVIGINIKR